MDNNTGPTVDLVYYCLEQGLQTTARGPDPAREGIL